MLSHIKHQIYILQIKLYGLKKLCLKTSKLGQKTEKQEK